ncbi:hypothetical protein M911_01670 [Ectothiorhodospira haloalkaliphila]|uniref:ParB/Sulfiredoxin domain-containing protein n=1 Tax=Ectothiorhodospira haloalkaliphila TaxID=421628 RepID=W8KU68_9GAMM|nr:hypothetical protein [Ectothiorhodospira haloalkaliphila]AHK80567.1 hypothetical protein M911_01670 [Ectothiorhodospira haloalkaliphila]
MADIRRGKAFKRKGRRHILIDTETKLLNYMSRYLAIMKDMQTHGYREDADPHELGIAVSAAGELLKISSGKHRLAMAQVLGLTSVPVRVHHISREWWRMQTSNAREPVEKALVRVLRHLGKDNLEASA